MGVFRSVVAVPVCTLLAVAMIGRCAAQVPYPTMQPLAPASSTVPDPYPPVQNPPVPQNGQIPLTPDEKRQQEIDKYDPRNPINPAKQPLPGERGASATPNNNNKASQTNQNNQAQNSQTQNSQTQNSQTQNSQTKPNNREETLPGSVAESNQDMTTRANPSAEGPDVVSGDSAADQQTYAGPAVLSRSYTISRPMELKELKWSWTASSAESWQNGLISLGANGQANTSGSSFGTSAGIIVKGRHFWKRDQLGLDYNGSYSKLFESNKYSGANQQLNLDYQHYFSRHLSFNLVESGSILSQNYTLENPLTAAGVTAANLDLSASPSSQVLDQTVRQFMTQVGMTWQKSARLSFTLSSAFFAVDRSGSQLSSNIGYQSQADVNYRYTRQATVGAYYSYTDYVFSQHTNVSDSHTVGLIHSYAFNRTTQLRLRAGIAFLETQNLTLVPLDPAFAALVGQLYGVADIYQRHSTTDLSGQFIKDFSRKRSANISYAHGIAPGNGLILTSIQQVISGSFSALLFRRYTLTMSGGRSTLTSEGGNAGNYTSEYGGINISRQLRRGPSTNFSVDYRTYAITGSPGIQHQFRVSSGFTWGPGPGRLW